MRKKGGRVPAKKMKARAKRKTTKKPMPFAPPCVKKTTKKKKKK